jgi:hypothetical protein
MIYMWFTGVNYYKLAVEKDRDSIVTTIWKPGFYFRTFYGCSQNTKSVPLPLL